MLHRSEVADKEQGLFRLLRFSLKYNDIFVVIRAVDPLKAFRIKVLLIQCRMGLIQLV